MIWPARFRHWAGKTDLAQPRQLNIEIEQLVGGIFGLGRIAKGLEKLMVQGNSWRSDVLKIEEDAAGVQQSEDLGIQAPLPLVRHVMNRKAGYDRIEWTSIATGSGVSWRC